MPRNQLCHVEPAWDSVWLGLAFSFPLLIQSSFNFHQSHSYSVYFLACNLSL